MLILLFWAAFMALCYFVYGQNKWLFYFLLCLLALSFAYTFTKIKHKIAFFACIILLLASLWLGINYTPFQNFLVKKVAAKLSKSLKTKVEIKHIDFSFFNKMNIEGILVEDRKQDTLLYAGLAKVNITDWFFFKDSAVLKYTNLTNTVVNLKRTDSIWNYQFLIDYFNSPNTGKKKKQGLQLELKDIEIENLIFNRVDEWVGQNLVASIKKFDLKANSINLNKKIIDINSIDLVEPIFTQRDYQGNKSKLGISSPPQNKFTLPTKYKWNNDEWSILVNTITLKNGIFALDKETERLAFTDKFDGQHMLFNQLNGSLKNVQFLQDTLSTNISLSAKEKNGLDVQKINAFFKLTPAMMEFNQLELITPKSKLSNYYVMRYENFNADMNKFINNVKLEGKFINSKLHSDDIALFAPTLKTWNRLFELSGNARGTIDNLVTKNMLIKSGNTIVDGDITLSGLPDITTTFIDFKSRDLRTTHTDLLTLIPSLKKVTQPQLSKLGTITFKGNYTGFINDFVAYGSIGTNLGTINVDINMKLPAKGTPIYSGKISTTSFNLSSFLNTKTLGNISVNGKIKGKGFTAKDVLLNFDGTINQVQLLNYNFQNLIVKGTLDKKLFKGNFSIKDPNLMVEDAVGIIDFNENNSKLNLDGFIRKADLKKLNITNDEFIIKGKLNLNFKGKNIDTFLGGAAIDDALITHNGQKLSLNNFTISSTVQDGLKALAFSSNDLEGTIKGEFTIEQLPDAFTLLLNKYYPSYFKKPLRKLDNQNFSFDIKTKEVDEYVQIIDRRLKGFNNTTFVGNLKIPGNELNFTADIPEFSYDGKTFVNTHLQSVGTGDTLATTITVDDIGLNDSLHLPQSKLILLSAKDMTTLNLTTSASKTLSDAQLNASIQTLSDGVKIHFFPSSFILNDKKWNLEEDGELTISKSTIDANQIKFSQGNQSIIIGTKENDVTGKADIVAELKNVNITDFTPFIKELPRLEGILTGSLTLQNPFGNPFIEFEGNAENFTFEDKKIGKINLSATANTSTGKVRYKANADEAAYKFNLEGDANYKDSLENVLDLNFISERFNLEILDPYLEGIFSNMQGNAVNDLRVTIGKNGKTITGTTTITDGSFKVNYTQCTYKFTNETIVFNPNEINLGEMELKDTLNNTAKASGKMYHNLFDNFEFDNVRLNSQKLLVLNTTKKDNSQFYGKVIGNATLKIDGPVTDMRIDISGEPSRNEIDSNHIYIPSSTSKENGTLNYIEFIQFGTKMDDFSKGKKGTNILVNMDLKTNPTTKIDVILDEETGDIIKGRGNGDLKITVGTKEPLSIRGTYTITGGEYTFNFQTVLKKYFTINNGTIVWNGDPYKAVINIKANYLAANVDVGNIPTTSTTGFKQKADVNIISTLTGELQKPIINFEFVADGEIKNDFVSKKWLDDLKNNPNEMNKQIVSVLLFNSFINSQQNFLSGGNVAGLATNTIGGIVSSLLTNLFNKELEKATKGLLSTYIDLSTTVSLQQRIASLQASVSAGFKILLSNRLQVLVGGNLDYNNPYAQLARRGLLTPDISVQWLLNKDGSLRVVGFNRTNTDLNLGQRNRSGVSLSFRKDFDKFGDLFKKKKR